MQESHLGRHYEPNCVHLVSSVPQVKTLLFEPIFGSMYIENESPNRVHLLPRMAELILLEIELSLNNLNLKEMLKRPLISFDAAKALQTQRLPF